MERRTGGKKYKPVLPRLMKRKMSDLYTASTIVGLFHKYRRHVACYYSSEVQKEVQRAKGISQDNSLESVSILM
jgi:hypothetical protein